MGIRTVVLVENALDGLRWVLDNHDRVKPRIRVVNSFWAGAYFDPDDPFVSAIKARRFLVKKG